eukprot:3497899-Prymnesium_polylepis.1
MFHDFAFVPLYEGARSIPFGSVPLPHRSPPSPQCAHMLKQASNHPYASSISPTHGSGPSGDPSRIHHVPTRVRHRSQRRPVCDRPVCDRHRGRGGRSLGIAPVPGMTRRVPPPLAAFEKWSPVWRALLHRVTPLPLASIDPLSGRRACEIVQRETSESRQRTGRVGGGVSSAHATHTH